MGRFHLFNFIDLLGLILSDCFGVIRFARGFWGVGGCGGVDLCGCVVKVRLGCSCDLGAMGCGCAVLRAGARVQSRAC